MDYGPVVFPASGFPRKNLGVDLCDCLHYLVHCLILFLIAQRGKRLGLMNCIPLNWSDYLFLVFPTKWYQSTGCVDLISYAVKMKKEDSGMIKLTSSNYFILVITLPLTFLHILHTFQAQISLYTLYWHIHILNWWNCNPHKIIEMRTYNKHHVWTTQRVRHIIK